MTEPDEITTRGAGGLGWVAIGAWVFVAAVLAAAALAPPAETPEAQWFDKRESIGVIVVFTAIVISMLWAERRAFGSRGPRRREGRRITGAVALAWALPGIASAVGIGDGGSTAFLIPSLLAVLVAMGTTVAWGSPRAIVAAVAGNWLGAGGVATLILIQFVVAPPAHADICLEGGMDCMGRGGPNESIAWIGFGFVLSTGALVAITLVAMIIGALGRAALARRERVPT